jgi:hypothetical protein
VVVVAMVLVIVIVMLVISARTLLEQALGMALGLIVEKRTPSSYSKETSKLFFFVGG